MSDDLDFEIMKNESLASSGNDDRAYETTDSGNKESRRSRSSSARLLDYGPIDVAVPNEWEVRPLSEKYDLARGVNYSSAHYCEPGEGLSFYTLNSVAKGGGLKKNSIKYYDEEKVNDQKTARNRDILIANTDLSQDGEIIGYPVLIPEDEKKASFSHHLTKLVGGDGVNTRYLSYLLQSDFVHRRMIAFSCGSTVLNLNSDLLRGLDLAFPPLPEQRKIASVLYTVDQAIQKTEAIIEQAKRVKRGLMQDLLKRGVDEAGHLRSVSRLEPSYEPAEMISGVLWSRIEAVPQSWEMERLGTEVSIQSGFNAPSEKFTKDGGIPLIRNRDLGSTTTEINYDGDFPEACLIGNGDLLVSMDGEFKPRLWWGGRALLNQRVCKIETSGKLNTEFLRYALDKPLYLIQKSTAGTTVKHLSKSDVRGVNLPTPPLQEQREIAARLLTVEEFIDQNDKYILNLKRLKKGLMQDLLTGEVRTADKAIEVLDEVAAHG